MLINDFFDLRVVVASVFGVGDRNSGKEEDGDAAREKSSLHFEMHFDGTVQLGVKS